jgi:hypothetical protein
MRRPESSAVKTGKDMEATGLLGTSSTSGVTSFGRNSVSILVVSSDQSVEWSEVARQPTVTRSIYGSPGQRKSSHCHWPTMMYPLNGGSPVLTPTLTNACHRTLLVRTEQTTQLWGVGASPPTYKENSSAEHCRSEQRSARGPVCAPRKKTDRSFDR